MSGSLYDSNVETCACKGKQIGASGFNYEIYMNNCHFKQCDGGLNIGIDDIYGLNYIMYSDSSRNVG